jgi:hypothetical protein
VFCPRRRGGLTFISSRYAVAESPRRAVQLPASLRPSARSGRPASLLFPGVCGQVTLGRCNQDFSDSDAVRTRYRARRARPFARLISTAKSRRHRTRGRPFSAATRTDAKLQTSVRATGEARPRYRLPPGLQSGLGRRRVRDDTAQSRRNSTRVACCREQLGSGCHAYGPARGGGELLIALQYGEQETYAQQSPGVVSLRPGDLGAPATNQGRHGTVRIASRSDALTSADPL